jgi:hypothetical protein
VAYSFWNTLTGVGAGASASDEFIDHTYHLFNFILIPSFNQKAIFMGNLILMQWLCLERMKVYYSIKILDTTFSTHLHTNRPVNLTFTVCEYHFKI